MSRNYPFYRTQGNWILYQAFACTHRNTIDDARPSGPSSSLKLKLALGLEGDVREHEGAGGSAGGGVGVSGMNQFRCTMKNWGLAGAPRSVGESS